MLLNPSSWVPLRIIDHFAGALMSGMDRLRGPINAVASTLAGALQPAIAAVGTVMDGLASAAEALLPLLKPLGTALEGVMSILNVLTAIVVEVLLEAIKALIPDAKSLESITEGLVEVFVGLAEAVLRTTGFLLALASQEKLMRNVLESLVKERDRMGLRAGTERLWHRWSGGHLSAAAGGVGPGRRQEHSGTAVRRDEEHPRPVRQDAQGNGAGRGRGR